MKNLSQISCVAALLCLGGVANAQIFNGGGPDQANGNEMTAWLQTEDFVLGSSDTLGSVKFWGIEVPGAWDGTIEWWVFNDSGGTPGSTVASGTGVNITHTATGITGLFGFLDEYVYTFDLNAPVALNGGTTYWLGLHASADYTGDGVYWETTSAGFGSTGIESQGGTQNNWFNNGVQHAFELYSTVPEPGTFVAIGMGLVGLTIARRRK